MQTTQVSVWIPIVVGIIGLSGVIVGQLINAWREDRRWRREQQREDIRWEREHTKELARVHHENVIDWRGRRLSVYGDCLQSILDVIEVVRSLQTVKSISEVQSAKQVWTDRRQLANRLEQQVRLIASEEIRDFTKHHALAISESFTIPIVLPIALTAAKNVGIEAEYLNETRARVSARLSTMWEYYHGMVDLMRNELGVTPTAISKTETGDT